MQFFAYILHHQILDGLNQNRDSQKQRPSDKVTAFPATVSGKDKNQGTDDSQEAAGIETDLLYPASFIPLKDGGHDNCERHGLDAKNAARQC